MRRSVFWLLDHHPGQNGSVADLHARALAHATRADELGYYALWLAEHHFRGLGTTPNPAVLLAALAQRTTRIRLGPAVSVLPLRDPTQVAEDYGLVDILSGGRLNMGVGTGSREREFAGFGIDFDGRRASFDERLAAIRDAWAAAESDRPCALNVRPIQTPVPIYVATLSEEGAYAAGHAGHSMLTLAAPLAKSLTESTDRIAAHRRGLLESGHDPSRAEAVLVALSFIAPTDEDARRLGAPALGRLLTALSGVPVADPEAVYDRMRAGDLGVFGSAASGARVLSRYAEAGVEHVAFFSGFGGLAPDEAAWSLEHLASPDLSRASAG